MGKCPEGESGQCLEGQGWLIDLQPQDPHGPPTAELGGRGLLEASSLGHSSAQKLGCGWRPCWRSLAFLCLWDASL